ncbi:MAG TPA: PspC domain-containing protein [Rhodothermales bacterium]|nr:PspC domain-containing protein [Bacteroidota bacterium]HRK73416.1 PspC domain-containing protein [Rhodothermales bacterium]HRR09849.1 PspC domain-containing protein [Rhodothermales bacterium]
MKYLVKSSDNKKVLGVCAGLAAYLNVDPTWVRVGVAFGTFFTGFLPGIVLYVIAGAIMPDNAR